MDEVEKFFCQFPNPWTLRVSGMGGYTSKCEKKSKSLHPSVQADMNIGMVRHKRLAGTWEKFDSEN
jgi:hypothetical protein